MAQDKKSAAATPSQASTEREFAVIPLTPPPAAQSCERRQTPSAASRQFSISSSSQARSDATDAGSAAAGSQAACAGASGGQRRQARRAGARESRRRAVDARKAPDKLQPFNLSVGAPMLPPNLGSPQSAAQHKLPPPIPNAGGEKKSAEPFFEPQPEAPPRRTARRRPAGPVRSKIAANDDAPSIGGLIYALDQKPSGKPFRYAAIASIVWGLIGAGLGWAILGAEIDQGGSISTFIAKPTTLLSVTAIVMPIAILWFLALLAWRSEELRLRSSTMTEVAIRLAEPDRMAEQSVASLGQAVRRQVAFMNDAISRALGRAGELEALVHNEVSALERSYEENEQKIRGLIQELSGERHALLNTSERVTDTLKTLGTDIPTLIDKLSNQQIKLAHIIKGAGDNLTALESAVGQSTQKLESTLGARTDQLQTMLEGYTEGLATALGARTEQLQDAISGYVRTLDTSLTNRTESLQAVFEEYAHALDTSLTNRAQALDIQLVERTKALDAAFGQRLRAFDESIMRSTMAIDSAVGEKARALTSALDTHARTFSDTISRQAVDLDESSDERHQLRAPHEREHHAPVVEGHRRPRRPVRGAAQRLGKPPVADPQRDQPLRGSGPGHHVGGQQPRDTPTTRSTPRSRAATPSSRRRWIAYRARPTSSAASSRTTRRRSKARSRKPRSARVLRPSSCGKAPRLPSSRRSPISSASASTPAPRATARSRI